MAAYSPIRRVFAFVTAAILLVARGIAAAQSAAGAQTQDEEVQIGQEVFEQLKAKGEIIESSPVYDQLKPIACAITKAAQPRYSHPFTFYLVHEEQPNALATPGGNVYVVDSLMYFVKNKEQLAGTLCPEVSHTPHYDRVVLMEKQRKIEEREVAAAVLMGRPRPASWPLHLSERVTAATWSHAQTWLALTFALQTGYNLWGLVWLFQDFQNANTN